MLDLTSTPQKTQLKSKQQTKKNKTQRKQNNSKIPQTNVPKTVKNMSSKEVTVKHNDKNFFMAFQAAAGAVKCEELLLVDDHDVKENTNESSVNNSIRKNPSKRNLISEFQDAVGTKQFTYEQNKKQTKSVKRIKNMKIPERNAYSKREKNAHLKQRRGSARNDLTNASVTLISSAEDKMINKPQSSHRSNNSTSANQYDQSNKQAASKQSHTVIADRLEQIMQMKRPNYNEIRTKFKAERVNKPNSANTTSSINYHLTSNLDFNQIKTGRQDFAQSLKNQISAIK